METSHNYRIQKCALLIRFKDSFGGAERRLLRCYNVIAREMNIYVIFHIVSRSPEKNPSQIIHDMGISVENFKDIRYCYSNFDLLHNVLLGGYSVIHFFDASPPWFALTILSKLFKIKTIETIAQYYAAHDQINVVRKILYHTIWRMADHVDLLYPDCENRVRKYRKNKSLTCTPGTFTDLEIFVPQKKEKILLFSSARLEANKGPQILVEAISQIADHIRNEKYKVIIAGKGYLEKQLWQKIIEYHIEDVIQMVGYIEPQKYMPKAEAVFSLQVGNYPSQVVAEAAASGCCVIATTSASIPHFFLNDSFALFCNRNAASLSDAILKYIMLDEREKKQLQENARTHAERHFNICESVDYFEKILNVLSV